MQEAVELFTHNPVRTMLLSPGPALVFWQVRAYRHSRRICSRFSESSSALSSAGRQANMTFAPKADVAELLELWQNFPHRFFQRNVFAQSSSMGPKRSSNLASSSRINRSSSDSVADDFSAAAFWRFCCCIMRLYLMTGARSSLINFWWGDIFIIQPPGYLALVVCFPDLLTFRYSRYSSLLSVS